MPACAPVSETAGTPIAWSAIAVSAIVVCSPVASSTSISRSGGASMICLGELDQTVGHAAHRGDDDHDLIALGPALAHTPRDVFDALGVADRGAAVLLNNEGHV